MTDTQSAKPMTERRLLARNVRTAVQVKDLDSGEWLTVKDKLHITCPLITCALKVLVLYFTDGSQTSVHPADRLLCRNAADGAA